MKVAYEQTEIGEIPEDWAIKPLTFVLDLISGTAHERSITPFGKYVAVNSKFISSDGTLAKFSNQNLCPARLNDILMVMSDLPNGRALAKCYLVAEDDKFTVNQRVCILRARQDDPHFLFYQLNCNSYFLAFDDGVQQTNLTNGAIRSCPIIVPLLLDEQQAIAGALLDADALIASLDALIAKKRDLKQATMQQLLTGKTRLPGFTGEWEVKLLGSIAEFYKGKGLPKSAISSSGQFACIHYGELFTFYGVLIREIASRTDFDVGMSLSKRNDVLMPTSDVTPTGLAKASCVKSEGIILGGDILVIRSEEHVLDGVFLASQIRYHFDQIMKLVSGSTVYHLYASDMRKFTLPVPAIEEQLAIVSILRDMDADLAALEAKRDKAHAVKQGMMQELLTGRIRLV